MKPFVSIIVPTYNNEATVVRTLKSLTGQTLRNIEIVIVDNHSSDGTMSICRDIQRFDPRIGIVQLDENQTALEALQIGVTHATGTYVMFCDVDDELVPQAAEEASSHASKGDYDIVHFGTSIINATGSEPGEAERALDPFGIELFGKDILLCSAFGRHGAEINGQVWNKLYERRLIGLAWKQIDPGLRLSRAENIYQILLILANATRYSGLACTLYHRNSRVSKSRNVASYDFFQHLLTYTQTYQAIKSYILSNRSNLPVKFNSDEMLNRLRGQFVNSQLDYWFQLPRPADSALGDLLRQWGPDCILEALAEQHQDRVHMIVEAFSRLNITDGEYAEKEFASHRRPHIALLGNISAAGGVQKVMAVQAELLIAAGYSVTVLSFRHEPETRVMQFPSSVEHRSIGPRGDVRTGVVELTRAIREGGFSAVLNHDNYSPLFPWVAAVTRTLGIPSALFLHSFALRAFHDFRSLFAYLPEIARSYDITVTLSEADRMWWEASGVPTVVALPNFGPDRRTHSSPLGITRVYEDEMPAASPVSQSHFDLLWVGRLQDDTKNVSGLLEVFAHVAAQRPQTTLAIVGGEQRHGERDRLEQLAERLDVREQVLFAGRVQDVGPWYRSAKVFITTSSIEGFNLTLIEAQAHALPVTMFALPYLETVKGNPGIVAVDWGATECLARAIVELLEDPVRAEQIGADGREFALKFSLDAYNLSFQKIVSRLCNWMPLMQSGMPEPTLNTTTAIVPTAIIDELYRLYEGVHLRAFSELQVAKRESANLRRSLSRLKRALLESKEQHQQLESAIAQIKNKMPIQNSPLSHPATAPKVEGIWPLWGRKAPQSFSAPLSVVFDDLASTDPVALPAAWALDSGVLGVATGRHFNGSKEVTRYEFIEMLHRLAGAPLASFEIALYRDLDSHDAATAWAFQRGILKPPSSEINSGTLPAWNPNGPLLRRSAAMILFRAAGGPKYRAPQLSPYSDLAVNQKVYKEMCWAADHGILPPVRGEDNALMFDEKRRLTRSESVVALFHQMFGSGASSE